MKAELNKKKLVKGTDAVVPLTCKATGDYITGKMIDNQFYQIKSNGSYFKTPIEPKQGQVYEDIKTNKKYVWEDNSYVEFRDSKDGKSAYQSYVDTTTDNPPKTEAEWVASLKGEDGVSLGEVAIADNLTTDDAKKVLSAREGYLLGQKVNDVDDVPTAGSEKFVKSGGVQNELALGAVYDVSAKNPTAGINNDGKWESLSTLLSDANLNNLIPTSVRKGGMSIKFVQSSDNKYVQYRYMLEYENTTAGNAAFINPDNWQGITSEITEGSKDVIESGSVEKLIHISFDYNGYINESNGTFTATRYYRATGFIRVNKGDKVNVHISTNAGAKAIACYSEDKTYMPNAFPYNDGQNQDIEFICPDGVGFISLCDKAENTYYANYRGNLLKTLSIEGERITKNKEDIKTILDSLEDIYQPIIHDIDTLNAKECNDSISLYKTIRIDKNCFLENGVVTKTTIIESFHHVTINCNDRLSAVRWSGSADAGLNYVVFESTEGVRTSTTSAASGNYKIPVGTAKIYFNFFGEGYVDEFIIDTIYSQEESLDNSYGVYDYTNHGYINNQGVYKSSSISDWYSTDYIDVSFIRSIKVLCNINGGQAASVCFYDESKNPILPVEMSSDTSLREVVVPNTARYVRGSTCEVSTSRVFVPTNKNALLVAMFANNEVEYIGKWLTLENGFASSNGIHASDVHKHYYVDLSNKKADFVYFSGSLTPGTSYVVAKNGNTYTRLDLPYTNAGKFSIPDECDGLYLNFFGEGYVDKFVIKYSKLEIKLFDSVNKPIEFNGKTLVAFGDSITYGVCSPNLGSAGSNKYISLFCNHVGATEVNLSVAGSCIATDRNAYTSIYEKITSFSDNADIIWIAGGVNDWQTQSPIGNFSDTVTTTVYGAMNGICSYLKTNYPDAVVIFVTPLPTTSTKTFGNQHPDNLILYNKVIQEVAAANGFNVINGRDLGLPNKMTSYGNAMFAPDDCVHPTLAGHALYARSLAGKLL